VRLKIENVTKTYDGITILNGLNVDINGVKVVGIIGESGCGKSTLLRHLAGIEFPDSGTVTVNETLITKGNLVAYQKKIGVVFQRHSLFPHLTVEQNIMLILKVAGVEKVAAKARCDAILAKLQLCDQAHKIPAKISGGQAQRAAIARAISTQPELLFLDEPTASLDPLLTKEVLHSIQQLKADGAQFVFVTHEMDFLRKLADYYVFMDDGCIVEHGNIVELAQPKTEKLRKFILRT